MLSKISKTIFYHMLWKYILSHVLNLQYVPIFFVLNRDVESQLNEMRRPLLNQMVELWKTMGLTHLQEARIDPMLGYFKGKYLCTLHPLCFISNRSKEACTKYSLFLEF